MKTQVFGPVEGPTPDKEEQDFIKAEKFEIFDENGKSLKKFRGLRNTEDDEQVFAVVSPGYKIAQHIDVYNTLVDDVCSNLGMAYKVVPIKLDDGARLRMVISFPEIRLTVGDDILDLVIPVDNSYNLTTGLRGNVYALKTVNGKRYLISAYENYSNFYHKHTKGMDLSNLKRSIEKGIEVFQTKMKAKFDKYASTKIDTNKALLFLEELEKNNPTGLSKRSIKTMQDLIIKGGDTVDKPEELNTQWKLYNVGIEAITAEGKSTDSVERATTLFDRTLDSNLKKFKDDEEDYN